MRDMGHLLRGLSVTWPHPLLKYGISCCRTQFGQTEASLNPVSSAFLFCFHTAVFICLNHLRVPLKSHTLALPFRLCLLHLRHLAVPPAPLNARLALWRCTGQPRLDALSPARILNVFLSAGPSASACVFAEHVFVCVCRPFSTPLGSLICFGSVWWAGHEANYLLKGKSEPNEPHQATELTGLIKHSVCITGRLPQEPTVCWISHGAACVHTLIRCTCIE